MREDFFTTTVQFLTDPRGIGFPLLLIASLGVVLYLMNYTTKQDKKSMESIEKKKEGKEDMHIPHKPF